jgi:hypothetical protein
MSKSVLGYFDHINRMITLTLIILSGFHCSVILILLLISLIAISESYLDQSKTICHFHFELGSDQKLPPGPFWV